jgi:hypothetical protein
MSSKEVSCYCAFCRIPRRVYSKQSLSPGNVAQAVVFAAVSSLLFWQRIDPKGILLLIMAVAVIEAGILFRRRWSLACPHCGFDPIVYKRSPALACERVKMHIQARQDDPDVWLARKPPLKVSSSKRKNKNSTRELVV